MKKAAKDSKKQVQEKAVSKAQQKFMGMVYATKKGEKAPSSAVAKAAKGMSTKAAKDYAQTKHKGLPQHVGEGVSFTDTVKNSTPKMKKITVKESVDTLRKQPIYTTQEAWDHYAQELEEEKMKSAAQIDAPVMDEQYELDEIARIPQSELSGWGSDDTLSDPVGKIKKKELPGGSGYTYAVNKNDRGELEIMIFDGENLAGELDLFETKDVLNTWGVETVVVSKEYRGRGIGKSLYGIALSILKLTLEAGQTQTKHGQAMWLMLNSIPGVKVVGYNMVPTDKYKPHQGDNIVKQDKEWTRYTFPVESGKRSMRSGRPGTGLYSSQASMIAKWTGQ